MDRAQLLQRADMLHSMAMEMNAHDGPLAGQYNAYGHLMAAMQDVLTELYGAEFAAEVRNDSIEHGEAPSAVVKYRRNCDHAEAEETADAEEALIAEVPAGIYAVCLDSDNDRWYETNELDVRRLIADGIPASFYSKGV